MNKTINITFLIATIIVLIGISLSFIRGPYSVPKFDMTIDIPKATEQEPISVDEIMHVKVSTEKTVQISIFNTDSETLTNVQIPDLKSCPVFDLKRADSDKEKTFLIIKPAIEVESGEEKTFESRLIAGSQMEEGKYFCKVVAKDKWKNFIIDLRE